MSERQPSTADGLPDERVPSMYSARLFMKNAMREVRSAGKNKLGDEFEKQYVAWEKLMRRMEEAK